MTQFVCSVSLERYGRTDQIFHCLHRITLTRIAPTLEDAPPLLLTDKQEGRERRRSREKQGGDGEGDRTTLLLREVERRREGSLNILLKRSDAAFGKVKQHSAVRIQPHQSFMRKPYNAIKTTKTLRDGSHRR